MSESQAFLLEGVKVESLEKTNEWTCGAFDSYDLNAIGSCRTIEDIANVRAALLSNFLYFTRVFFELRTAHEYKIGTPLGHESHYITMARDLRKVFDGKIKYLAINIPPRYGKSMIMAHFVAWSMARYPDSNYLYISYGKDLATDQTTIIRDIMSHPVYSKIFPEVKIDPSTGAKDDFKTTAGGHIFAMGKEGAIIGRGAGIMGCKRWGGAIIIDDLHKAGELLSDVMRKDDLDWYDNTASTRVNDPENTPIIIIGQRLHEEDIFTKILAKKSTPFHHLCLSGITPTNEALCPHLHSLERLREMEKEMPYEFAAQYMQNPQPAGGALFKPEDFPEIKIPDNIFATLITCDTAETTKTYNDATVFSFWGLHYIEQWGNQTDMIGLIWLDCEQMWVEPSDLERCLQLFYQKACTFKVKPYGIAIEKKSTGTSLISYIRNIRGVNLIEIERTKESKSKMQRFIDMQPYIKKKHVSLPIGGAHNEVVREHMRKITPNNSHKRDDICDTCYDAVKLGIIDKVILSSSHSQKSLEDNMAIKNIIKHYNRSLYSRERLYGKTRKW